MTILKCTKIMKRILIVFGTRPEAIKMAPLVHGFKAYPTDFDTKVCVTAQHREMLDQVLNFFEIIPDYDLNLMRPNQNLYHLTADLITGLKGILEESKPDLVFVHGDTTTSMAASIASFYFGSKICHVEAGLRTNNKLSPFPEEINRQITGRLADFHFAPTSLSRENLISENISPDNIVVTGNTVIDALLISSSIVETYESEEIRDLDKVVDSNKRVILVTGHRRENHGEGFISICNAIKQISKEYDDVQIVYPVHLNPNVVDPVYSILGDTANVHLLKPLSYPAFVWIMKRSYLILTDSGGIQEEAPSLGKPVLVLRNTTERPEAVEAGTVILVGTNMDDILNNTRRLLDDHQLYASMSEVLNPYGDGHACEKIINAVRELE